VRCGNADDFHFRRPRGSDSDVGILEDKAPLGWEPELLGAQQKNFRIRFAVGHVGRGDDVPEILAQANQLNHQLNVRARRGRADDARDAGRVQPLQKLTHARQGLDPGRADNLPVKLFL